MSRAHAEHCQSHSPLIQTTETSSNSASLPGLGSFYSPPGCKTQTAACPVVRALKRLSEDFRSLLLTPSPRSMPACCWLPTKRWMESHSAVPLAGPQTTRPDTLQPLSSRCLFHHLWPGRASQGLAHLAHQRPHRISAAAAQRQHGVVVFPKGITVPADPKRFPSTAVLWATDTAVGPTRQTRSLAVCCMKEEEKVRAARQQTAVLLPDFKDCQIFLQLTVCGAQATGERLGTRIVPQFPVAVQPSTVHTGSLHPARADTEAVAGEDAVRIIKMGVRDALQHLSLPFSPIYLLQ